MTIEEASVSDATDACYQLAYYADALRRSLNAEQFGEALDRLRQVRDMYEHVVKATEQVISPELNTRLELSKAIDRAISLGIDIPAISEIYSDEIDKRI